KDDLVLLDIYGTNHDPDLWKHPHLFRPDRFVNAKTGPYDFIPQGGGNVSQSHRCAGESLTVELMKASLKLLVHSLEYIVPNQDLEVDFSAFPARPKSGFVLDGIR